MSIDPVCGMIVDEKAAPVETRYKGYEYYFCTTDCKEAFKEEPKKYLLEFKEGGGRRSGMRDELGDSSRRRQNGS